jgi:hypothetical protein
LFRSYYRRQLWDPETAAMVNGRPIYRSSLEAVMRAGLNPGPSVRPGEAALTIRQILDRLVAEELVRQEALAAGLEIPDDEVNAYVAALRSSMECPKGGSKVPICQSPPAQGMDEFLKAVRARQQLEKLAQKVIPVLWRPSSPRWRSFWAEWLAKTPKGPVYRVRGLFVQANDEALKAAEKAWRRDLPLTELETKIRVEGFIAIFSRVMSVNPLDPNNKAIFGEADLGAELDPAGSTPPYLTKIFRLPNSYVVLEVQEIRPALDPEELAKAARKAFERAEGEAAFREWVEGLRRNAEIVINPNYLDLKDQTDLKDQIDLKDQNAGPSS